MVFVQNIIAVFGCLLLTAVTATGSESLPTNEQAPWRAEIRMGVLVHDVDNLWSHSRKEDGVDLNAELILAYPDWQLLAGRIHSNLGASVNTQGDTSKVYGGLLWEYQFDSGIFLNLGLGGAVHDGRLDTDRDDTKSLGSRILFRIPIEIGYAAKRHHRISIMFDHISNGYLANPNQGLDTVGLRYGYRF